MITAIVATLIFGAAGAMLVAALASEAIAEIEERIRRNRK